MVAAQEDRPVHLVGREQELEAVTAELARSRVVVLVGPAGVGKSALAAALCIDRPVLWIDARDSLAEHALPRATTGRRDSAELVVVDGVAEHEPAERIAELLQRTAMPVVLTSRHPLQPALVHVHVSPLTPDDGAALLRSRIPSPGRAATLPTAELRRLSEALGGLPGALCRAAPRLSSLDVADLLAAPPSEPASARLSEVEACVLQALAQLPGPVTTRLLSELAGAEAGPAVTALLARGEAQVYPSGATSVRLAPGAVRPEGGREAVLQALAGLLPGWEALAAEVEHGGWRDQTARLAEDRPALELLCAGDDPDLALRAASVVAVVCQRLGPERRILELDAQLPVAGDPLLAARWAGFAAQAAIRFNDGPGGLAALHRRPAPAGTQVELLHAILRARLLEVSGERDQGARLRAWLRERVVGTPHERDACYGDAVSRYWRGDFEAALPLLERVLELSDPEVHSLRVVKAAILQTLLRRELGGDPAELLARLLPIDPLWRRTECEEGPTVVVLLAALRADLGHWDEADALLGEAAELFLRRGRRDEAANQVLQRGSLLYVLGRVPSLELATALGSPSEEEVLRRLAAFSRAEVLGWRAVRAAALGRSAEAQVHVEAMLALHETVGRPLRAAEKLAYVVAALIGAGAEDHALVGELLPRVRGAPLLERMQRRLASALEGASSPPPAEAAPRFEEHVLDALLARRHGIRVQADGSWFAQPGREPVSLARKLVLRRALAALAAAPRGLTLRELVDRTWPDERFVEGSGRRRAEVAISNLRALGLREAIQTVRDPRGTRWRLEAVVLP